MDIQATVPDADKSKFSNTTFAQHIPLDTYNNSGTIELDLVLHYKDGEVPRRAGADCQLEFERAGAFQLDESRALIYLTPAQSLLLNLVKDPPLDGGGRLRQQAALHVEERIAELAPVRLFSIRHDFPTEWAKFKSKQGSNDLVLMLKPEHYPFWTRGAGPKSARGASAVDFASEVILFAGITGKEGVSPTRVAVQTSDAKGRACKAELAPDPIEENLLIGSLKLTDPDAPTDRISMEANGEWTLSLDTSIEDLWIAVAWGVSSRG